MRLVGVDGCPGGWVAIAFDRETRTLASSVYPSFAELLAANEGAACIAIDIPIGLSADGPRRCDVEARRVLGLRRSSVFPAPDPRVIDAPSYTEALTLSRTLTGLGISKQGFAIYGKVAEVNRAVTPALQGRVIEVHPEVSFWALAGRQPMTNPKGKPAGYEERRRLLATTLGIAIPTRDEARALARPAAPDDVLDAIVAGWTALRYVEGRAGRLPEQPDVDGRGVRMEIVF